MSFVSFTILFGNVAENGGKFRFLRRQCCLSSWGMRFFMWWKEVVFVGGFRFIRPVTVETWIYTMLDCKNITCTVQLVCLK